MFSTNLQCNLKKKVGNKNTGDKIITTIERRAQKNYKKKTAIMCFDDFDDNVGDEDNDINEILAFLIKKLLKII